MAPRCSPALLLALAVFVLPSSAQAGPITLTGNPSASTSNLANFTGSLTYTDFSPIGASVTISLTNTTSAAQGGFLTGFVFNNPGNSITGVSLSGTNANFKLIGGTSFQNTINGAPFGTFDIGAALGANFLGGGSPNGGIPVGGSATFTFSLTGTGLNALSASSFGNEFSSNPGGGGAQFFVARFKGLVGGSDKVPADIGGTTTGGTTTGGTTTAGSTTGGTTTGGTTTGGTTTGGTTTGHTSGGTTTASGGPPTVPEPTTALLMGLGLAGFAAYRWRAGRKRPLSDA
jgi:hypothetical protein